MMIKSMGIMASLAFVVTMTLCGAGALAQTDLTVTNRTVTLGGLRTYGKVTLTNRGRILVTAYNGNLKTTGFLHIKAKSITIDATSSIIADARGYRGRANQDGEGPGGGKGGKKYQDSGGGGGYAGKGGAGVRDRSCTLDGPGGAAYGSASDLVVQMGSAGGAAGTADRDSGGPGGNGGGIIILEADTIVIAGTLSSNGANGRVFNNDAAGGGAGGGILILSKTLTVSGTLRANGGTGGNTDDKGGGGSGGRIKYAYTTAKLTGSKIEANAGTGPGCAQEGAKGSSQRVNRPPTLVAKPTNTYTIKEGQTLRFSIEGSDPENHVLTFLNVTVPPGLTRSGSGNTRTVTWTPTFAQAGSYTINFRVRDNGAPNLLSPLLSVKITVQNVNRAPVFSSKPVTTATEDKAYRYNAKAADPDGGSVTYSAVSLPKGAKIDPKTGGITWTPGDADAGKTVTFTIQACDSAKPPLCTKQSWSVKVANVNDVPRITSKPTTNATEDKAYTYDAKATDPDPNESLTWSKVAGPSAAKIDPKTGKLTWTPSDADAGKTVTFTIRVCDKAKRCVDQTWTVKVANVNDKPRITTRPNTTALIGQNYEYAPKAIDPDPNESLTWSLDKAPAGAKIDPKTGKIAWTPGAADNGKKITFTLKVCDKAKACVTQSWEVVVGSSNKAPQLQGTPPQQAYVGEAFNYQPKATDPNAGDVLTWRIKSGPPGAAINAKTGELTWTPTKAEKGKAVTIEIEVCDNGVPKLCATQKFTRIPQARCRVDIDCQGDELCVQTPQARLCQKPACNNKPGSCKAGGICVDGKCTSPPCIKILCKPGTVCRPTDGVCVSSCTNVKCPKGQRCDSGQCVSDPCTAKPCGTGEVCDTSTPKKPVCIKNPCTATSCKQGRVCRDGRCVENPCGTMTCPNAKDRCLAGLCVPRQSCGVDLDCPGNQICESGVCVAAGCYKQKCAGGTDICIKGQCKADRCQAGSACPSAQFCRPIDGKCVAVCANVSCAKNQQCLNGKCQADPCASVSCQSGERCVQGKCVKDLCTGTKRCKYGRLCSATENKCVDDPCAGVTCPDTKQVCRAGQCQAPPSCRFDVDCQQGSICVKGSCVLAKCSDAQDCQAGERCRNGACEKDPCDSKQCAKGEFCRDGNCVASCAGVFCNKGESCVDGKCTNDPCAGVTCQSGERCVQGKCQPDPCKPNACAKGRVCDGKGCIDAPCRGITCATGLQCRQGQCVGDKACTHDVNCSGSSICINKKCAPSGCYRATCAAGKLCLEGACKDNPCASTSCASDEFCRPSDGTCVKVCPRCSATERCRNGRCEPDPCAGVRCGTGTSCVEGKCVQDPCLANTPQCRYQRLCRPETCRDDACTGVKCPAGSACSNGQCIKTDSGESGQEVQTEIPPTEIPVDTASTDSGATTEVQPETEQIQEAFIPDVPGEAFTEKQNNEQANGEEKNTKDGDTSLIVAGGGCGCQQTNPSTPWLFLGLCLLCLFSLRRRRHNGIPRA